MKQLTNQNKKRASAGIGETINCAFKNCSDHFYILKVEYGYVVCR